MLGLESSRLYCFQLNFKAGHRAPVTDTGRNGAVIRLTLGPSLLSTHSNSTLLTLMCAAGWLGVGVLIHVTLYLWL